MVATSRRELYKEELRTAILQAARELFVQEGFEGFSMRKLAGKIEYSPGNIYLYFKNKDDLFQCLVDESFARLQESLVALHDSRPVWDPVDLLKQGLRLYVEFGLKNPNDYRFAFILGPAEDTRPYRVHPAFEGLRARVRRCVEAGRFRSVDIETTSQVIWAAVHGLTSLLIQRPQFPWKPQDELITTVIDHAIDPLVNPSSTPDAR